MAVDESDDQYFGLAQILGVFRRRWRWLLAGVIVCMGAVLAFTFLLQDTRYTASSKILLSTVSQDALAYADPTTEESFYADRLLQNALQVIESQAVQDEVETQTDPGIDVEDVSASILNPGSDVVELSVDADDPAVAAELANRYATTYIDYSRQQRLDDLASANAEIQERIDSLTQRRSEVAAPLNDVSDQLDANPGDPELQQQRTALQADLQSELQAIDQERARYLQIQEQLQVTQGLAPQSVADVLEEAEEPSGPSSPKRIRNGVIGLILGLGLGTALAFAREFVDQRIRSVDDLQRAVKGRYPTIGLIPDVSKSQRGPLDGTEMGPSMAESVRSVRTAVKFSELDRPLGVIQVTSPSTGDGKSTLAANLTTVLAQAGHRVALICCDFRRAAVHAAFDVPRRPGFADVIVGDASLDDAVTASTDQVHVLPAGSRPPNPSELLDSERAEKVIDAIAGRVDYAILDSTPILPVTDAAVASRFADATIVVVRAGETTRGELQRALESLEMASAPVLGLVLNGARADLNRYGYDYTYRRSRFSVLRRSDADAEDQQDAEHATPATMD